MDNKMEIYQWIKNKYTDLCPSHNSKGSKNFETVQAKHVNLHQAGVSEE